MNFRESIEAVGQHTKEDKGLVGFTGGGEVRVWNPTTGTPLTSLPVAGSLSHLSLASTTIAAAGERGPYFLALCRGIPS